MLCSFIAWMRLQSSGIAGCGDGINFAVELFCIFAASYSTLKRGHCRIHLKRYVLFAPESAGRLFTGSLGRISFCYTVHNAAFVKQPLDFGKMFYNYKVKPPKIKYCADYRLQWVFFSQLGSQNVITFKECFYFRTLCTILKCERF